MRYQAPHCPWCPSTIRAWREGQPWSLGQVSSTSGLAWQIEVRTPTAPEPSPTAPARFDDRESTRITEIIRFAKRRGYRKIGVATCADPEPAAEALCARLVRAGFEVILASARQKSILDAEPWLPELGALFVPPADGRCSPEAQASVLNAEECDLNVAVGLCVGCDSLFFRHAEAPTTVLRVGQHAPDLPKSVAAKSAA